MNKHLTVLAAGALLTFSACNSGNDTGAGTMTQAQIDSAVNARTAEQEARIQRNNDSLINAMAQAKADSMTNAGMQKQGTKAATVATGTVKNTTRTSGTTKSNSSTTTKDGRLNIDKSTTNSNTKNGTTTKDGRLNIDK